MFMNYELIVQRSCSHSMKVRQWSIRCIDDISECRVLSYSMCRIKKKRKRCKGKKEKVTTDSETNIKKSVYLCNREDSRVEECEMEERKDFC